MWYTEAYVLDEFVEQYKSSINEFIKEDTMLCVKDSLHNNVIYMARTRNDSLAKTSLQKIIKKSYLSTKFSKQLLGQRWLKLVTEDLT